MEAIPKDIQYYTLEDGSAPVIDWLEGLKSKDVSTYDRIIKFIERVEDGNTSNFKPEGGGITELKMDFGPGYRIYFGQDGKTIIVMLVGGDKSTQTKDIATARAYWSEYNA